MGDKHRLSVATVLFFYSAPGIGLVYVCLGSPLCQGYIGSFVSIVKVFLGPSIMVDVDNPWGKFCYCLMPFPAGDSSQTWLSRPRVEVLRQRSSSLLPVKEKRGDQSLFRIKGS